MNYFADLDISRNMIRRVQVIEVDDSGSQQLVRVTGLQGEEFRFPYRGQYFGATGVPPVGSDGFAMLIGGRPDQAFLIAIEHKDHRLRDMKSGEKAIYDAHGNVVKLLDGPKIEVESPHEVVVKAPTVTIDADTLAINANIRLVGNIKQEGKIESTGAHIAASHD